MSFSFGFPGSLGVLLALGLAGSASAQTCAAPFSWHPGPTGDVPLTGTTCGHETGIFAACQDAFGAPGEAFVATFNVADGAPFTSINATGGSGYTLAMYLVPLANGCGNFTCTTTGDETTDLLHNDIPPGDYYLIITGADFDAAGACGNFVLVSNGWLPVTLQAFAVD